MRMGLRVVFLGFVVCGLAATRTSCQREIASTCDIPFVTTQPCDSTPLKLNATSQDLDAKIQGQRYPRVSRSASTK